MPAQHRLRFHQHQQDDLEILRARRLLARNELVRQQGHELRQG